MNFLNRILRALTGQPRQNSAFRAQARSGDRPAFPPTFGKVPEPAHSTEDLIFDPAVQQYRRAYRRGDPVLPEAQMQQWQSARRTVMRHLLEVVADTEWANSLVLRGSLSLKASLGNEAREPGDIDWVVQPATLRMNQSRKMIDGIVEAVIRKPRSGAVVIDIDAITTNEIWTYSRAPGHRLAFPWACGSLPAAMVQMDFVFEQKLHISPAPIALDLGLSPPITVLAANDCEALAWKLLWLFSDIAPQGKDLYDAVLLAERTALPAWLLERVLDDSQERWRPMPATFPFSPGTDSAVDWENFLKECPWVSGEPDLWISRLRRAIAPAVEQIHAKSHPGESLS